jgi:hypothetical protein
LNNLEETLIKAMRGEIALAAFLRAFVDNEIAIPSRTEVGSNGAGLTPVIFVKEGVEMMAVYTDRTRLKSLGYWVHYYLAMPGRSLIQWIPSCFGIVVNPGLSVGLDVSPSGIQDIRRDFVNRPVQ